MRAPSSCSLEYCIKFTVHLCPGVTCLSPDLVDLSDIDEISDLEDSWMLSGSEVTHNSETSEEDYSLDLDDVPMGGTVAVRVTNTGELHYAMNGVDLGCAARGIPQGLPKYF